MFPLLKLHWFLGRRRVALKLLLFAQIVLLFLIGGERFTEAAVPISAIRQPSFSVAAAQDKKDVRPLEPGKFIEREMKEGETHFYQITLSSGQYLNLEVIQLEIDVVTSLLGTDGEKLIERNVSGKPVAEQIFFVAEMSGNYQLEIRPVEKNASAGRYEIRVAQLRVASEQDRRFIAAAQSYFDGIQTGQEGTKESRVKAIKKLEESLSFSIAMNNSEMSVKTLSKIGDYHNLLGDNKRALECYSEALSIQQTRGNRLGEANLIHNIGWLHGSLEGWGKSLDYYNEAVQIYRSAGEQQGEARVLESIAAAYRLLGDRQKCLAFYNQALQIYRNIGDRRGESSTLKGIAYSHESFGDKQNQINYLSEALPIVQAIGESIDVAVILSNIGKAYSSLNNYQKAVEYFDKALLATKAAKNSYFEVSILLNIGLSYTWSGEYQKGLDMFTQALKLDRDLFRTYSQSFRDTLLTNIGFICDTLGDKDKALALYTQSLLIGRTEKDVYSQAGNLTAIGFLHASQGNGEKALEFLNQALPLARLAKDRRMEGAALCSMGLAYDVLNEKQKALEYLNQGLERLRAANEQVFEAMALIRIGLIHNSLGDAEKGSKNLNEALAISRNIGDRNGEANTLYEIARAARTHNSLTEARSRIEEALKIVESLRSRVNSQELRTAFLAAKHDYYNFYLDLLMQLHQQNPSAGHNTLALQISERARARSLLETLIESRADIRQGVDPTLLERERDLQRQINAQELARTKLLSGKPSPEQAEAAQKELQASLTQFQEVQAQIRANSPRYAALTQPEPLTVAEIQKQVLDNDTILLEYALGAERSYLWAVTSTSVASYELPARAVIEKEVSRIYKLVSSNAPAKGQPDNGNQFLQEASSLSRMLLGPVASHVGKKRLVIVADGALQFLPFGALPIPASAPEPSTATSQSANLVPLLVEHEIVNLPSASVLAVLRRETANRKPAAKQIAVLADPVFDKSDERVQVAGQKHLAQANTKSIGREIPSSQQTEAASRETDAFPLEDDLPRTLRDVGAIRADKSVPRLVWTREEANTILATVPAAEGMKSLDFNASRATATSAALSQYRIVHFATHGMLNSEHPELSGLVFSLVDEKGQPQDGFLRMHDVYNLNLPADLVVLSACQTGLGKEIKGEGLVGLTRGFMYAGAPRVVASLWSVNDYATSELMKRFYQGMLGKEKLRPAEALRAAQLAMWKQKRWQAPYYWAAFVMQGEWR